MLRRPTTVTRRRVAAHACPGCRRLWALSGSRIPSGAWVIACTFCGWHDVRGGPREVPSDDDAAPDAVPADAALAGTAPAGTGAADTAPAGTAVAEASPTLPGAAVGRLGGPSRRWSHGVLFDAQDHELVDAPCPGSAR